MAKKKRVKYSDYFASSEANDNFGTIFNSMCKCKKFQELPPAARWFYALCRVESQTSESKACLYRHASLEAREYAPNCFVFPAKHQEQYGIKRQNGSEYFKLLIDAGFIEYEENNAHRKVVNVYRFSTKWKDDG